MGGKVLKPEVVQAFIKGKVKGFPSEWFDGSFVHGFASALVLTAINEDPRLVMTADALQGGYEIMVEQAVREAMKREG